MSQVHTKRTSDHPYIDAIWSTECKTDGMYTATPDGAWDLIYAETPDGEKMLFFAGQQSGPQQIPYKKGERSLVISFTGSTYLKDMPKGMEFLPIKGDQFTFAGHAFPLPTLENAEALTDMLAELGLLKNDEVVARVLNDKPKGASPRTVQLHFKAATGLTMNYFEQIRRAQEAVRQLQAGKKPLDVASDVGYTDQAHMIRSLKKIMGRLPSNVDDLHKL